MKKILITGLPGAGKTTLAKELAKPLNAVHLNADEIRQQINKGLGFSLEDRLEHARRMGVLADIVVRSGNYAIADFVCPTEETRALFNPDFIIWCDRIKEGRFEDTNKLYVPPSKYDVRVTADGTPLYWSTKVLNVLVPVFDTKKSTALFIGRYQPFHDGHKKLIEAGLARTGQVCIAVRDTQGMDEKNPFSFQSVERSIRSAMKIYDGRFTIVPLPNITDVFYGRDVGYNVERIDLDSDTQKISATKIRQQIS